MKNSTIIVTSFGTSSLDVINNYIEPIEKAIANKFNTYNVQRAFTSQVIRNKLYEKNRIRISSLEERIEASIAKDVDSIIVQPTMIFPGYEYSKIKKAIRKYDRTILLGKPLIYSRAHYMQVVEAYRTLLPKVSSKEAILYIVHGTKENNDVKYRRLEEVFNLYDKKVYVCTINGNITIEEVIREMKCNNVSDVLMIPFMISVGYHKKDIIGNSKSFKSILENEGFNVKYILDGIGRYEVFHDLYIKRVAETITY